MFGWLFGGSKAAETAVDTGSYLLKEASSGIDMMFYTDEEKAQAKAETYKIWLETQKLIAQQGTPQAVTRRLIAVPWMFLQMGMTASAVVAKALSFWTSGVTRITADNATAIREKSRLVTDVLMQSDFSDYILALQNEQFFITLAIIGFYFGPAAVEMAISKWKKKK